MRRFPHPAWAADHSTACRRSRHSAQAPSTATPTAGRYGWLRALWDSAPFSLRVLWQMRKAASDEPCFGEDFLWVLLAAKADG